MQLDDKARKFISDAKAKGASKEDTMQFLQSKGYDLGLPKSQPVKVEPVDNRRMDQKFFDKITPAITGIAQGATFGLADEIAGALDPFKTREDYRAVMDKAREDSPVTSMVGDVAGGIGGAILSGGSSLIPKAATTLGKVGIGAGVGGGIGLLEGFGRAEGGFKERAKEGAKTAAITAPIGGAVPILGAAAKKIIPTSSGRAAAVTKGRGSIKNVAKDSKSTKEISKALRSNDNLAQKYAPEIEENIIDTERRVSKLIEKGLGKKNIQNEFQGVKDAFAKTLDDKGVKNVSKTAYNAINTADEAGDLFRKAQRLAKRANPKLAGMDDDSIRVMQDTKSFLGQMERKGGVDSVTARQVKREIGDAIEDKIKGFKDLTTDYAKTLKADELATDLSTLKGQEGTNFAKKMLKIQNKEAINSLIGEQRGSKLVNALRQESKRFRNLQDLEKAAAGKVGYGDIPTSKPGLVLAIRNKALGGVEKRTAEKILSNAPTKGNGVKAIMAAQPLIEGE